MCSEGTRYCREGVWSGCESVHSYVVANKPETQRVVDPKAGQATCSICDLKCFKVVDNLLSDAGTAGGNVAFAPGGGLTLLPGDGGINGMTADAGGSTLTGCTGLSACCSTLSGLLQTVCTTTAAAGVSSVCDTTRNLYCPSGTISGPVQGCTLGSGPDTDCDGIPNAVDYPGKPLASTNNQTIFHQLDIGETAQNSLNVTFKLKNADIYFLLDMTNTMKEERDNLIASLTNGNVINCAQLNQCCNRVSDASKRQSCQDALAMYTNRPGKADDQTKCLAEQMNYCPGNKTVDCPDLDYDGQPDNALKEQGVVGATRCLVGSSWFGAGYAREIPIGYDPEGCTGGSCGTRYADRDEQTFRHIVDMTSDYSRVRTALQSMVTNGNWDEPEGGMMALYSLITGKGHYFGINRPAVPSRLNATGCAPNSFGYPCFRKDAVPIVVFFTDRPHHNGPDDTSHCNGLGAGCPYNHLTNGATPGTWTSGAAESSSDKQARRVPVDAESFTTAFNIGDVRGQYLSLVGDTRFMVGDYPAAIVGCGADANAPDTLLRFKVGTPAGATGTVPPIAVNFHLTKDDAYAASKYGYWMIPRTDDPSPAVEFGSVVTVYRGVPNVIQSQLDVADKTAIAIASGPDSTYLTYVGATNGSMSMPGYLGGISGCGSDGQTNQVLFTFRPTGNAHIVVDSSESSFPTTVSLHDGLPSALPKNPNTLDNTSAAIANSNDTFATANAVPGATTAIDGAYVERTGDSKTASIHADYTAVTPLVITGVRSNMAGTIGNVSSTAGLYVGMALSNASGWSASPVRITSIDGSTLTMSATWNFGDDAMPVQISFDDSLVGCGVDPQGNDAVFKFNVSSPRRVRIDTEGSSYDTVISLHDDPPPSVMVKNDVSGNANAPGYVIGDVTNSSYTVSDVGTGTSSLSSTFDYLQCGADKTSNDAMFKFQLSKTTHLGLDVSSSSWNPIVALFGSVPGTVTSLSNAGNTNDRISPPGQDAFDIGDVYGQLDTKVTGSTLSGLTDNYDSSVISCSAYSGGRDSIFKFTPSGTTTVRVEATPSSGWLPVVAVFDGPPPTSGGLTSTALFDAATAQLPDSNCLVYSFHDPALAAPAHTYAVCPSRRYSDDANSRCQTAGMDSLATITDAAEQSFLAGTSIATTGAYSFHIGASDVDGDDVFNWRDNSVLTYTNWASGEPKSAGTKQRCVNMTSSGTWVAGKCNSSGSTNSDNAYYVCEGTMPAVLPPEDASTAYAVNPLGTVATLTGSTRRMHSDYNGAILLSACGGTIGGGDAVFKVVAGSAFELTVDGSGSSFNTVLGLFDGTIDASNYKACSAPGSVLDYNLLAGHTYYVVLKGTAATPEGNYKLKFADKTALSASGVNLGCNAATTTVPKSTLDVDVSANHTYYVVVDQANSSNGAFDLVVHSLYRARADVDNAASANENGATAVALPDPYRSRITVSDTSTAGMTADYGTGPAAMCSASAAAPDAVYKFTPSLSTNVRVTVTPKGSGLGTAAIGVFDGLPASSAVAHDLTSDGNPNEALASAQPVSLDGPAQQYFGDTSGMKADVDPSLLSCGAYPNGRDAVFSFSLSKSTEVEIDASASTVADPVINLFRASPLARPAPVTLENDTKQQADAKPAPTPTATASWLYYSADMAHLSAESQTQLAMAAVNADRPPPTPVLQPQDLGDVSGKRISIGGGDTSGMTADYPGGWSCGASDSAPDAIYKFYSSTNATVHVKATPGTGYDAVVGLYDGTNGLPLGLSDLGSLTEDTVCVSPNGPKNLTNVTLKALMPMLSSAPAVNLNCGATMVSTTDPDGTGPSVVTFSNWCGTQPPLLVQSQAGGADAVVFVMGSLKVASGSSLRMLGSRPAIFIVTGNVTVDGTLSAAPDPVNYPNLMGAGGDFGCGVSLGGNAGISGTNSGGGGGGGYGTAGGLGGFGTNMTDAPGGLGGVVRGTATLVPLLGGCSGGRGGAGANVGLAGGALQISAAGTIIVTSGTGSIAADGGSGQPGASGQLGGTGGGSGGALLLQAPTLVYTATQLSARGGLGGQGFGDVAANGGTGSGDAATDGATGQSGTAAHGGGGGGGGYGRVVLVAGPLSLAPCTMATNENASSAWPLVLDGTGRQYIERGNTSTMTADHGGMCGTPNSSPDAVYAFTLSQQTSVQIDATASTGNTVLGLFSAGSLGQSPVPTLLENDARADADVNPAPTPDIVNNWVAYKGDLSDLTVSTQPQTTVDNAGNANEIIPTELGDPINRRVTVVNANTSGMTADYLAPSCSTPAADNAKDAIYRFVPSQSGQVRVSANYSQTGFDPVIALYRGTHQVTDERVTLINLGDTSLAHLSVDSTSVVIRDLAHSVVYQGPSSATPDYQVVYRDSTTPVGVMRTATSTIPNGATVLVDYTYDSGAPLPVSQQLTTNVDLNASGNANERADSATQVPIGSGRAYQYSGDTTAMTSDIDGSLFSCGPPNPTSHDAVFDFTLDHTTTVEVSSTGSSYNAALGLFSNAISRPSTTVLSSPPAIDRALYDANNVPGAPEPGCTPYPYNTHRYWFCSTERPWAQAEGRCQSVGLHLVTIEDSFENAELLNQIQSSGKSHHIGFEEVTPYTNSWGAWTSGGGGTTGSPVSGRFSNWAANEPNALGDCVQLLPDGTWDDDDCATTHRYVCELNNTTATPMVPSGSTCGALVTYNGHKYRGCTDTLDWTSARGRCTSVGMDLARIDDQAENDQVRALVSGAAWTGGNDIAVEGQWGWADGTQFWLVNAFRNWAAGEPSQPTTQPGSRMKFEDGTWMAVPLNSQNYRYICEDPQPSATLAPPTVSTPQLVDVFSSQRAFHGSTTGAPDSVGPFLDCGAVASAPDAVFQLQVPYVTDLRVDITGSFANAVLGLFSGSVSAPGYMTCGLGSASAPQLTATLQPGTYYVVLTGATNVTGAYKIRFDAQTTDPNAFKMENDTLSDAMAHPLGGVDGNWYVRSADMNDLTPTIGAVRSVDLGTGTDINDTAPLTIDPVTGYQVSTANAATDDLRPNYPGGSCNPAAAGNDAIYRFTPTTSGPLQLRLTTSGWAGQMVMYDGTAGAPLDASNSPAVPVDLKPTNANENRILAKMAPIGKPQAFLGDLTSMTNDVDAGVFNQAYNNKTGATPLVCNGDPFGHDAFFTFNVPAGPSQTVEITTKGTSVPQTLALWDSKPFTKPSAVTKDFDTKLQANMPMNRLGTGDNIDDDWVVLRGDTHNVVPSLAYTTVTETVDYQHDDNVHALGDIKGRELVTVNSSTSGLKSDYLASTLQCGSSDVASDAVFSFTHSTGGRVMLSLNNPTPAFVPALSLFKGMPGTAAGAMPDVTTLTNTNEAEGSAYDTGAPGTPKIYSGTTAPMANSYTGSVFTQGSAYGSSVCSPDAAGKDAFFSFTVPGTKGVDSPVKVELSTVSAGFDHTIALWDTTPITQPAAGMMSYDTRAAANAHPIGVIDDGWVVEEATMSSLFPDGLTASTPTVANTDEIQTLGDPVGKRINISADTSASGLHADYSIATMGCGTSDAPNDIIYKLRPSANTTVRVATNNPSNPGFNPAIAVFNGTNGDPLKISQSGTTNTTPTCVSGFQYTPSNINLAGLNFTTSPSVTLGCGGTVTFNSTTATFTSGWCTGQTKPTPVTQTQSGGSDMVVLPFSSLTINAGTTLKLIGSRPVVLAVNGSASIAGVVDASASGSTAGAGGNYSCGSSAGADGVNPPFLVDSTGGGGGGFGTGGGVGGSDHFTDGATAGGTRGNVTLVPLTGGCNGGVGGNCTGNPGGAGGGAVQISAGGSLTVSGSVLANGGTPANETCGVAGGPGGGAGGGILLEGRIVTTSGTVAANGGNGGDGTKAGGGNGSASSGSPASGGGNPGGFFGAGGGGGGYGRIRKNVSPCLPTNESTTSATTVPIGQTQTFIGNDVGMASNLTGAQFTAGGACSPDSAGPDAFWTFTLTASTQVSLQAQGTDHNHTLTLFNSGSTATACNDGNSTTGASINQTLAAGTYYVGIKSRNGGVGGNYSVAFSDVGAASPYAMKMACSTTNTVDAVLSANTDYYVVVKGAAATQQGTYNLTVTDIGAVTDFGCGTDLSAPDAYFEFDVSSTSARKVTIGLNEDPTHLDGAFQLVKDGAPFNDSNGDSTYACETSSQQYSLTQGKYYVIVRGMSVASGVGNKTAQISIRDDSGANALDCADGSSTSAGTITRTLDPGTYYAGITSRGGATGGAYQLRIRDASINIGGGGTWVACGDGNYSITYDIPPADANKLFYAVVKGAAGTASGTYTLTMTDVSSVTDTCADGDSIQMDPSAPDEYYAFNVADSDADGRDLTISLSPTSDLDGAYRLFHGNGTPVGGCHDKSVPVTYPDLPADNYYVVLRAKTAVPGGPSAKYELSINDKDALGSLECADGLATSGTTITRTLAPGDYWVGVKTQPGATNPLNYQIQFRDTGTPVPSGATEVTGGCASNVMNVNVTQNTPYYVVVKGINTSDNGAYKLTVTDLNSNGGFGCGDDAAAGDAYFEFQVNDPGGRRVTLDTEGSTLDTVVALFPANHSIDSAGKIACSDDGGATPGSSKITQDLAPGVYYAVVRAKSGIANPALPFQFSVRDDTALGSIACAATDANGPAIIRKQLNAGSYHLVLKGMPGSDKGAYKLRFRDQGPYDNSASEVACNDAQNELLYNVTAGKPYYAVVKGARTDQSGPYKLTVENLVAQVGMGCNASPTSPDGFYRFHLSADTTVQIDTVGSQSSGGSPVPTDTVIALYDTSVSYFGTNYAQDKSNALVNCDDDGGDAAKGWSKIVATLAGNRDYYVVVKSKNAPWGSGGALPYVVNVRDLNANQPIACQAVSSSPVLTRSLPAGDYRVVVSNSTGASGGGNYDVRFRNMSAYASGAMRVACGNNPDELSYDVTAGRPYYVVVKGGTPMAKGQYNLVVETTGTGATSMGCGANPAAPDAFFKFHVAKQGPVVLDTEGSAFDTVIALYDANTSVFGSNYANDAFRNPVSCDDNSGATTGSSRIAATLAPGDYYLVVKGKTTGWGQTMQPFNVSIRDSDTTGTIACASASSGGKKILQTLPAGDYNLVASTASAPGGAYNVKFRDTSKASAENGQRLACVAGGSLTVSNLVGGHDYYVVVKGNNATDAGAYNLTLEDTVSLSAASGSTSIACAPEGTMVDGTYPPGTYYALVTGDSMTSAGPYTLRARDLDALADQNRLACDDNGGPDGTSVIERDLKAGTHYVVVKGKGPADKGAYTLHVRDESAVPDHELACGGIASGDERLEYDVKAGQDYTVLLKGAQTNATGNYNIKLYDQLGLQNNNGQRLTCVADALPTTLLNSNWHTKPVDFDLNLTPDTYYVSVKGVKATDKGSYQLQIGEKNARISTTYTPPSWTEIKDALATSDVRVLPVIATGGDNSDFVAPAEEQAKVVALTTHAVRDDGTAIWQKIQSDGTGTGSGLITGIAQVADYLAMDVSLVAVDGPDPGASKFRINVAPVNTLSCVHPHPLVDPATGICTSRPNDTKGYSCNTQYACAPGSAPQFTVTFTNPADAPVPPNTNDAYGGYHFKLQIIGNKKYLLDEVPVYLIPTNKTIMGPPTGGSGMYQSAGVYTQDIDAASCPRISTGTSTSTTDLPNWSDLYFNANLPEGTSIDFELCTSDDGDHPLTRFDSCVWSNGGSAGRGKVTVRSKGTCADNSQCQNISGLGNGYCSSGVCQFIDQPKVVFDTACIDNSNCPNGPLGAGDYLISSRCETARGAYGYGHCVYTSQPADLGATLLGGEQGREFARVKVTLHADPSGNTAPTLYQWYLTYFCKASQ